MGREIRYVKDIFVNQPHYMFCLHVVYTLFRLVYKVCIVSPYHAYLLSILEKSGLNAFWVTLS